MSVPIIGKEKVTDPKDTFIAELMGCIGENAEVFRAIIQDVMEVRARLELPEHSLQARLLLKIAEVAESALSDEPLAGALSRIESGLVTKYLNWLKFTTQQ